MWTRIIDPDLFYFFYFLDGFGCPLVLKSWFSWFSRWFWLPMDPGILVILYFFGFSRWFWLSQWSSHLYRFGFLDGFTNSFCDQSCLKLHPILYFSRPLFALPARMSNNVWIQRVALQLASVRVRPY